MVLACTFCLQFILLIGGAIASDKEIQLGLFASTVAIACAAPILLALGCSGMLVGQERQSGTWAWSTSLPVSWGHALSSKLVVSILGSLVSSLPLALIPIGLLIARRLETHPDSFAAIYVSWLTLIIFLEVVVFCFLTTLLIRETLTALVVAGIGLAVVQIFVGVTMTDPFRQGELVSEYGVALFVCAMLLTGIFFMTFAFRWRWGIGQQATFAIVRNLTSVRPSINASYRYANANPPSEWWMMLQHSLANSFWLRLIVLLGAFVFSSSILSQNELLFPFLLLAILIVGVTAFEGDQTQNRFRFLADRGVAPWKLVVCRLSVVACLTALIMLVGAAFALNGANLQGAPNFRNTVCWSSSVLFIGAFSSMCFRKSVVAMTVGFVSLILPFAAIMTFMRWVSYATLDDFGPEQLGLLAIGFSPVTSVVVIIIGIFILSRRWLVLDDPKLAPHYLWISTIAHLSPVFLSCTFGFLFVPLVPWSDVGQDVPRSGPVLGHHQSLLANYQSEEYRDANSVTPQLPLLEEEMKSKSEPIGNETAYVQTLNDRISRTATFASICLREKDSQSALRFWRLNREFQELSHQFDPMPTAASRAEAMQILLAMREVDVIAMGGVEVVRSLIPSASDDRTAYVRREWSFANAARENARVSSYAYFPPLLWGFERKLAWSVDQKRSRLIMKPPDFTTHNNRADLLNRFSE